MVRKMKIGIMILAILITGSACCLAEINIPPGIMNSPVNLENKMIATNSLKSGELESVDQNEPAVDYSKKSYSKAVILSILLPGAGQFYLGEKGRGEVFMGVEVLTWTGFAAFRTMGSWKKNEYIDYAVEHAGVNPDGKDDEFYKNVSFYQSRDQYNESGRIIDPTGIYYPVTAETYWYWDSESNREVFRDMRNDSKSDFRNATFMIGVAVVNRILAGIDTFRIARKLKGRSGSLSSVDEKKLKLDFDANPFGSNPKVGFSLSKIF